MKFVARLVWLAMAAMVLASCAGGVGSTELRTRQDTLSWALGENIALSMKEMGVLELKRDVVEQAIAHTLDGKEQPLSDSAFREAIDLISVMLQSDLMGKQNEREAEVERQQASYFAQLEAGHPEVKKHEMGFYYEVLKEGRGPRAKYGEVVTFDYRSYEMLSGEPYDQTYGKRNPIVHVVGKPMFAGLLEGFQLMNAGSVYRFYFPYQTAFGKQGSGEIPGYTPFIYEVELHEISDR